jgi:hypothetical protein
MMHTPFKIKKTGNALLLLPALVLLFAGCGKVPTPEPDQPVVYFKGDFETGNLNGFNFLVVDSPVRRGNYALKNVLRPDDYIYNGYRTELALYHCAKYKTEMYYGFSFMIDTAYADNAFNLICQWQDQPEYLQGENWSAMPVLHGSPPPVALIYINGTVELKMNRNPNVADETFIVGTPQPVSKGQWNDVVFRMYWTDDGTAFTEAWLNGVAFTPFNGTDHRYYGANLFTRSGNYFKFGQYRGKDKTANTNVIYFDEVKTGSSYNDVAP